MRWHPRCTGVDHVWHGRQVQVHHIEASDGDVFPHTDAGNDPAELETYETLRKPRTTRTQENSLANEFMKGPGNADWVYGYDAWGVQVA